MNDIARKVADTILQNSDEKITINGKTYEIADPTPATLIMVSGLISQMPDVRFRADSILNEVLLTAKDCTLIGKIAAVLIIGAKRVRENRQITTESVKKRFSLKRLKFINEEERMSEVDYVADFLLYNMTSKQLKDIIVKRLVDTEITDFFAITTSLSEGNLLRETKAAGEVEQKATASGE